MSYEKKDLYAKQFSRMLQCPTVTGCDQKHFDDLHAIMWEIAPEFSKLPRFNVRNNAMIIKWEGKKHDRPLVLMAHQDVVPEEDPKGWKYPPYSGAIEEGKIWGRGAVDCKCMVFGSMVAANELINEGFVPEQDIYFCYGDDEENSGGSAIAEAKYLSETLGVKPVLVIDEGGGMVSKEPFKKFLVKNAGVIGVQEKGFADFKFIARSKGGHSSAPPNNTPFVRLAKFILYNEKHNIFDVKVLPILKELFKDLSKAVKPALRPLVKNAYHILPLALKVLPDSLSSQVKAFLSTTMVFTMAEGSHASNNIPDAAWVLANLRFSPQEGHDKCMKELEKVAKKFDIEIEVLNTRDASPCTDTKSEGYKFTVDMINKTYGDTVLAPYLIAGGTDCRYMQDICSTALRFTPFLVSLEGLGACHGYNERIGVDSLAQGVDFYRNVLTNFK